LNFFVSKILTQIQIFNTSTTATKTLINNSSDANKRYFDFVSFDKKGDFSIGKLDFTGRPFVPMGGSIIITVTSPNDVTFTINDDFTYDSRDERVYEKLTIENGENYIFHNINTGNVKLLTDITSSSKVYFDYALYDKNDSLIKKGINKYSLPDIPSENKLVISNVFYDALDFSVLNGFISYQKIEESAFERLTISKEESYIFYNKTETNQLLDIDDTKDSLFDYAIYKEDDTPYKLGMEKNTSYSVPAGGYIVITSISDESSFVYNNSIFKSEIYDSEALLKKELFQEESYMFINISNKAMALEDNASTKKKFNYVLYNADGTVKSQGNNTTLSPTVPVGGYVIITVTTTVPVLFYTYNLAFYGEDSNQAALETLTIEEGETYIFKNLYDSSQKIITDASSINEGLFDYAI
ncbi:hypothetical protein, partial [Brevibacillus daliensis]|uniref:hypothetical protein n=1 Tax=Brevibacillus daliensis TaxID=2892995 RepID=UPI001E5C879D